MKTRTEKASTHTAAPWEVRVFPSLLSEQPPFCKIIGAVEGDGVGDDLADVTTNYGVGGRAMAREEWEANARLMAVAPDLLSALIATWRVLDSAGLNFLASGVQLGQTSWFIKACDVQEQSRAVIAKAEGRP